MSNVDSSNNQLFSPKEMMAEAEKFALSKAKKTSSMTLGLAIMAGAFIGLAFVFYITVTTGSAMTGWGLSRLVGGIVFSMGLILIVLCGGELFTSSVLSSISWANREISLKKMLSLWAKVYIGNFIGAMFMLMLISAAGMFMLNNGQWGLNALNIAQHKLHHTTMQAFSLGVLCNLLVCLAIWMTFSSANALTKAMLMVLPVSMFVSSGFEHSVANMFMVPLGITIQNFAPEQFWQMISASPEQYSDLNIPTFLMANLLPVTLGNIVGGAVLVGLANWCIFRRPELKAANIRSITQSVEITPAKESDMLSHLTAKDVTNTQPITLSVDTPIPQAIDIMQEENISGAPVCDVHGQLVGFLSMYDVMKELWYQDYQPNHNTKVVDLMQHDVVAVQATDSLADIIEYMCIDKEQLYPTSAVGIATSTTALSLEERVKALNVNKPRMMPVLDNGQFVGIVTRESVMAELRNVYQDAKTQTVSHLEVV
ncbi:formate transporter FocA [Photobacterium lutimaris]|uniref:Formate transporter FocA n=1 Tax=Photobacterium lutimaris TaxID=388278 RepID=A0A2T3IV90_9GAMM|nr:formate transporter FocA [Photobacterium lutimaris]PSU32308.1 formate transporter FocA [Photobacterium lutimaris]